MAIPAIAAGILKLLSVAATTYTLSKATGADKAIGKGMYNLSRDDDDLSAGQLDDLDQSNNLGSINAAYDDEYDILDRQLDLQERSLEQELELANRALNQNEETISDLKASKEKQKIPQVLGLLGAMMGNGNQNGYLSMLDGIDKYHPTSRRTPIVPEKYRR